MSEGTLDRSTWELAHVGVAVHDLEAAMPSLRMAFGPDWGPIIDVDVEFRAPLTEAGSVQTMARVSFAVSPTPPLEVWDGAVGSPYHVPAGVQAVHHLAYWVDDADLERRGAELRAAGYQLEHTLPSASGLDELVDFAYFVHPTGMRIELLSTAMRQNPDLQSALAPQDSPSA